MNIENREIAISLRKQGKTYGEIIKLLKVPKSTVCSWLKNIKLSKSLKEKILARSKEKWRKNIVLYNKIYAKIRSKKARLKREKTQKKSLGTNKKLVEKRSSIGWKCFILG